MSGAKGAQGLNFKGGIKLNLPSPTSLRSAYEIYEINKILNSAAVF